MPRVYRILQATVVISSKCLSWNVLMATFLFSDTALGYGLDDRGSRIRFPVETGNFSLHHRVQNGSRAHPTSYPMGTGVSFLRGEAAGAGS
jgi:hypothetical protein